MKQIDISTPKHPNVHTLVDDCDYEWLNQWKWWVHVPKARKTSYAYRSEHVYVGYKNYKILPIKMHRLILAVPDGVIVDHRDGDGLNNQRHNLRVATNSQNMQNSKRTVGCSSEYKGVYYDKINSKWRVALRLDGKVYRLGRFIDEIEAAEAYDKKASELFGEFARLNFPDHNLRSKT